MKVRHMTASVLNGFLRSWACKIQKSRNRYSRQMRNKMLGVRGFCSKTRMGKLPSNQASLGELPCTRQHPSAISENVKAVMQDNLQGIVVSKLLPSPVSPSALQFCTRRRPSVMCPQSARLVILFCLFQRVLDLKTNLSVMYQKRLCEIGLNPVSANSNADCKHMIFSTTADTLPHP